MVNCVIPQCSSNSTIKNPAKKLITPKSRFFSLPTVITHQCEKTLRLSSERRNLWLRRIKREILPSQPKVCNRHFVSGHPSALFDNKNVDWAPTLNLCRQRRPVGPRRGCKKREQQADQQKIQQMLSETPEQVVVTPSLPGLSHDIFNIKCEPTEVPDLPIQPPILPSVPTRVKASPVLPSLPSPVRVKESSVMSNVPPVRMNPNPVLLKLLSVKSTVLPNGEACSQVKCSNSSDSDVAPNEKSCQTEMTSQYIERLEYENRILKQQWEDLKSEPGCVVIKMW